MGPARYRNLLKVRIASPFLTVGHQSTSNTHWSYVQTTGGVDDESSSGARASFNVVLNGVAEAL